MNNRREQILSKALELYLTLGYAGVSISVLQKEVKMGRATLYYYFKDKDDLFRAVVDHYYLHPMRDYITNTPKDILLSELIEERHKRQLRQSQMLKDITLSEKVTINNLKSLVLYAVVRFPDLAEETSLLKKAEFQQWKHAIENSIAKGEINTDEDAGKLTYIFTSIKEASELSMFVKNEYGLRYTESMEYLMKKICKA